MVGNEVGDSWQAVQSNPTFYKGALSPAEGERMRWHSEADRPHSSQVYCVSTFGALRSLHVKDTIINQLAESIGYCSTDWTIELEAVYPELLSEYGSVQPSSIDVLLRSRDSVIAVESKFLTDAKAGFGACSQPSNKWCAGFFGPGSDVKTNTSAWCRLEVWDGKRSPRFYWSLGRAYFQDCVFSKQSKDNVCPLLGANYQLMRNFLFAAAFAQRERLTNFGLVVVAPSKTSGKLITQLDAFKSSVLRPEFHCRAKLVTYEQLIDALSQTQDNEAQSLAYFLNERIRNLIDR